MDFARWLPAVCALDSARGGLFAADLGADFAPLLLAGNLVPFDFRLLIGDFVAVDLARLLAGTVGSALDLARFCIGDFVAVDLARLLFAGASDYALEFDSLRFTMVRKDPGRYQ